MISLLPPRQWTFVGGKGGVGKTTLAAALAVEIADAGDEVLVLSTDPAHSLGDALASDLGSAPSVISGVPHLRALEVDAERERSSFLQSNRQSLLSVIERGTYLENEDIGGFMDLALPGMDELAALLQLLRVIETGSARTVIDTAPTGHTLRLLELPRILTGWLAALDSMEAKHEGVAVALAGDYRPDAASEFLHDLHDDLQRFHQLLTDPDHTRFILVTTLEPAVLAETRRYRGALERLGVPIGGVLVNRAGGERIEFDGLQVAYAPLMQEDLRGPDGLRRFSESVRARPERIASGPGEDAPHSSEGAGESFRAPVGRDLYLVAGKGGVGKTTSSAALAVDLAHRSDSTVLLLSTDPAGSLTEIFGFEVTAEPIQVPHQPNLSVQQLDAEAVWDEFRTEYRKAAEELFHEMLGGGLSANADLEVVSRLVDLAPPGLDEVMALLEVVDLMEDRAYNALVLDTAPTGHLLRLLEMPGVALDWTHAMLRLLLKYREVVGLGDLAEQVLRLSRSLRRLQSLLGDPQRTWLLVVAPPESLSVPETQRLIDRLRLLGISPGALLINRLPGNVTAFEQLLANAGGIPAVGADETSQPPVGPEDLGAFAASWRSIS